jgi:hypothetical protein
MPQNTSLAVKPRALQVAHADGGIVLRGFRGAGERGFAARDDALHQIGRNVESGRAFRGIEHTQPAAGSRADIEEPSAGAEGADDGVDGLRDVGEFGGDGIGDKAVFGVDDPQHFEGGELVDARGGGVRLLGMCMPNLCPG